MKSKPVGSSCPWEVIMARRILRATAIAAMLSLPAAPVWAEWKVIKNTDAMTDEKTEKVCTQDRAGNRVCFEFVDGRERGLFITVVLSRTSTDVFHHALFPMLRVDQYKPHDSNGLIRLEKKLGMKMLPRQNEGRWVKWRVQVQKSRRDVASWRNTRGLLKQLVDGKTLKLRLFLHGGYKKDTSVSLRGFVGAIGAILPRDVRAVLN